MLLRLKGSATCYRRGLICLAKAKSRARVLPGRDRMRAGKARRFATGRAVFRVTAHATSVAWPRGRMSAFGGKPEILC